MKFVLLGFLIACTSDGSPPKADAPPTVDAKLPDGTTAIDAPVGNACTGALYDPCTDNTQCMSNNCKLFASAGLHVCTQTCDATTNPCPDQNGMPIACNNMQICRPTVANTCTR